MPEAKKQILEETTIGLSNESCVSIPIEHQQLVMERVREAKEHPEMMLDWDEVSKSLVS